MGTRLRFMFASIAFGIAGAALGSGVTSGCSSYAEEGAPPPNAPDATDGTSPEAGCPTGTAECDSRSETVCETKIDTDPSNCGYCGRVCPAKANAFPKCAAGDCAIGCNTGFADCNGSTDDGCETPVSNDPANCGACGRSCLGAQCAEGLCVPVEIASGTGEVRRIVLGTSTLYIGNETGVIRSMTKAGLSPTVLTNGNGSPVNHLAIAAGYLWQSNGNLSRCPESTCGVSPFESVKVTAASLGALAFTFDEDQMFAAPFNSVTGPSFVHVGPAVPVDGGFVEIGKTSGLGFQMAASSTHVYVRNTSNNVQAVPINGGDGGSTMVLDGGVLHLASSDGGGLVYSTENGLYTCAAPQCTGATELLNATTYGSAQAFVIEGNDIYVAFEGKAVNGYLDGAIVRCAVSGCGGAPFVLAKAQVQPIAIAVDATHVFWGTKGGSVRRVAK